MIKLERSYTPIKLSPSFIAINTADFKISGNNVWNIDWLKSALIDLSYNKCAYCECDITEESKYMEVEHFQDKHTYKDEVLKWDNLLPSCKRCNGHKGTHDVNSEPIVNPFVDNPRDYFYLKLYRLKPKVSNVKAETTISVLDLNNSIRIVKVRFELGEALQKTIDNAKERLYNFEENQTTLRRSKLISIVEDILFECQKDKVYSATCATVLHQDGDYIKIRQRMIVLGLWSSDLEKLHESSLELILAE